MPTYKVIKWKRKPINGLIRSIQEVVNRKHVRLVHVFRSRYILEHWSNNNIWIDDSEVELGFVF
jgi:hypothetical protein